MNGHFLNQILICYETCLYYKKIPGHTSNSDPIWDKESKETDNKLIINACFNASSSIKMLLLSIDKTKNPLCFHGIDEWVIP